MIDGAASSPCDEVSPSHLESDRSANTHPRVFFRLGSAPLRSLSEAKDAMELAALTDREVGGRVGRSPFSVPPFRFGDDARSLDEFFLDREALRRNDIFQ